jgi:hypothetical protein
LVGWIAGRGCELADAAAVADVVADEGVATLEVAAKEVAVMSGTESRTAAATTMAEATDRNLPGGCKGRSFVQVNRNAHYRVWKCVYIGS